MVKLPIPSFVWPEMALNGGKSTSRWPPTPGRSRALAPYPCRPRCYAACVRARRTVHLRPKVPLDRRFPSIHGNLCTPMNQFRRPIAQTNRIDVAVILSYFVLQTQRRYDEIRNLGSPACCCCLLACCLLLAACPPPPDLNIYCKPELVNQLGDPNPSQVW